MLPPIEIIRLYDPALDYAAMVADGSWEKFYTTREAKLAVADEGHTLTRFVASWPTRKQIDKWATLHHYDRFKYAFAECVATVDNARFPDGSRRLWTKPTPGKPLQPAELEFFTPHDVQHVGEVIYSRGFFRDETPLYLQPRATCLAAVRAAEVAFHRRRAAQTKTSSPSDNSSALRAAPQIPEPSSDGDEGTAATATE